MTRSVLITGITGLIGRSVLRAVLKLEESYRITALVRPGTSVERFAEFVGRIELVELDLADISGLRKYLDASSFDVVMHIGALRGGRAYSRETFLKANLLCTQQLTEYCLKQGAILLFCSSVGVYGAIPQELPANDLSPRNPDNYYHLTKIESEKSIQQAVLRGLRSAILRPAITYGPGDNGFPNMLVKMIDRRVFPLVNKRVWIHLCHIDMITRAFIWLLTNDWEPGLALNVADREPVQLSALVHFISRQLSGINYPSWILVDRNLFLLGEKIARTLKNELWTSRFELISRSWFYEVRSTYEMMELPPVFTIPSIQIVIDDYMRSHKSRGSRATQK